MTTDEQRFAVAEAYGWTGCRLAVRGGGAPERKPSPYGVPPGRNYVAPLPDYPRDLNAMHEAEKHLIRVKVDDYARNLRQVTLRDALDGTEYYWRILHATAAQRCEAFLKTIGKWKEPVP